MPASRSTNEFVTYIVDLMQPMGPVHAKSMFGGHGLYLADLTFAIIVDDTLYLKADPASENEFITRGLPAFSYTRKGKCIKMSYYQAPEDALEDSDIMNIWANKALAAALRAASKK
jgi:DNA transformation protein